MFAGVTQTYGGRYGVSVSRDGGCGLDVSEVRESDAGMFTCFEGGEASDRQKKFSAFLVVVGKPKLSSVTYSVSERKPAFHNTLNRPQAYICSTF